MFGKKSRAGIRFDFNNVMAERIGAENGLSPEELEEISRITPALHRRLCQDRKSGKVGFFELPHDRRLLSRCRQSARELRERFSNLVVLGIGGSALGTLALASAFLHPFHNELSVEERNGIPRIYIMDNIDPERLEGLLETIDLEKTLFDVVTKSGGTAETLAQFLIVRERLRKRLGPRHRHHIIATTTEGRGSLWNIARKEGYEIFPIPQNVPGRFSVLSAVGLLPAAILGIDIDELLEGAASMDRRTSSDSLFDNPAYIAAAIQFLMARRGKSVSVMMVYSQALAAIGEWYRQLWAESLGKKFSLEGEIVYRGPTPVNALGVTDQHSQLQLYIEGPFDKIITFVAVDQFRSSLEIPQVFPEEEGVSYLGGHTLAELFEAERIATEVALTGELRPNVTIHLPGVTPFCVGQLLFMLEVETAFAGLLFNVNAFDQPGVEASKIATYAQMERKGFEVEKSRIASSLSKNPKYIIS